MADVRCGLAAALQSGADDLRYPLGSQQPLAGLIQEFKYSQNHSRKISELLERGFTHFRRIRGDGNCFYRAAAFGWLEGLATRQISRTRSSPSSNLSFQWPPTSSFGELAPEYTELRRYVEFFMQSSSEQQSRDVGMNLLKLLLGNIKFDLCVVLLVRLLIADFMLRKHVGGDDVVESIMMTVAVEYGSIQQFVDREVLPLGKEAEGAAIVVAARQLGVFMRIVQLDGTSFQGSDNIYPAEDYQSPMGIKVCLLYRPGHYEILYHKDVPQLQDVPAFDSRCSHCRDKAALPNDGLLPCFHRLCQSCSHGVDMAAGVTRCPLCDSVPSVNWRTSTSPADAYLLQPKSAKESSRGLPQSATSPADAYLLQPKSAKEASRGSPQSELPQSSPRPKQLSRSNYQDSSAQRLLVPRSSHQDVSGQRAPVPRSSYQDLSGQRVPVPRSSYQDLSNPAASPRSNVGACANENGRFSIMPSSARPYASDVNARSPQSHLDVTFSSGQPQFPDQSCRAPHGGAHDESQEHSRCKVCNSSSSVRRVRCCNTYYCVQCLSQMISSASERQGLTCVFCRSTWDVQKLALACNIQLPAGFNASESRSRRASENGYPRQQGSGATSTKQSNAPRVPGTVASLAVPRVPATACNLASKTLPSSQGRDGYR